MTGPQPQNAPPCDLYIPGHLVHWIQAKKASGHPCTWGVLEDVREQVITVRFLDRVAHYRNHRADSVIEAARVGARVEVCERYGLLGIPLDNDETQLVCIADAARPWRQCSVASADPASLDELTQRMTDRGGFVVPAALLQRMTEGESNPE
jgi:hypothetical protein